ncbi:hypothetical protein H6G27_01140 [Nostoc linckia FACHB-104]|nr:hypothetical protein [Nostoc linckia FACHB-104]
MNVKYQQIQKLIVHPALIGLVATSGIVGSLVVNSAFSTQAIAKQVVATDVHKPIPPDATAYRSRWGFSFGYSLNSVAIEEKIAARTNNANSLLGTIDVWTQEHAQKIRNGAYEGGSEYPANIRITVYNNRRKLPLQKWIKQSNQFVATGGFKNTQIAGRNGLKFTSSGLYENEHVAFVKPKDSRIIVVTLSKSGASNNDSTYQIAYQFLLDSFSFN